MRNGYPGQSLTITVKLPPGSKKKDTIHYRLHETGSKKYTVSKPAHEIIEEFLGNKTKSDHPPAPKNTLLRVFMCNLM